MAFSDWSNSSPATLSTDVVESLLKWRKRNPEATHRSLPWVFAKTRVWTGWIDLVFRREGLSTNYQGLPSAPGFLVIGTKKTGNTACCSIFVLCFRNR